MLECVSLDLHNYSIWKDAHFDFAPGITFIHGANRSGKSALLKAMRAPLYGTALVPAGGRVGLQVRDGERTLELQASRSAKSNRYAVSVDGVAQHADRIADGRTLIDSLITIPESLYDTTVFLDGTNKHALSQGKASSRLEWIYEVLAFASVYERYAERNDAALKLINRDANQAVILREQLRALAPPPAPAGDVDALRERVAATRARMRELEPRRYQIEAVLNTRLPEATRDARVVQAELESVDNEFIALLEQRNAYRAQAELAERAARAVARRDDAHAVWTNALRLLKRPVVAPARARPKLERWLAECKRTLDHALEHNALYEDQASTRELIAQRPVQRYRDLTRYDTELAAERENAAVARRTVRASANNETVCSLCGSDLSHRAAHAADAAAELERATARIVQLERDREIAHAHTLAPALVGDPVDAAALRDQRRNIVALGEALDAADALEAAEQRVADMGTVRTVQPPDAARIRELEATRRELQHEYANAAAREGMLRGLASNPYRDVARSKLRAHLDKLRTTLDALATRATRDADALVKLQTAAALHRDYTTRSAALRAEFVALRGAVDDQKIMRELKVAFGRDGLPARRLDTGLQLFVEGLNEYAPLIWDEPYRFEVDVGPRRCDIIAHRNRTATTITDTMSGSEQRGWQSVCALSLLRILPPSARCNTIVLDELEANSTTETAQRYVREVIPAIARMVEQVVVVSPLDRRTLPVRCDREFVVRKRAGISTLTQLG